MKINYNATAMLAKQALERNNDSMSASTQRLSSGLKITSAKDDAAGYAISRKMNAQIRSLKTASSSSSDGISVAEIADGALSEIHTMLQRMNELAVKGATGTMTSSDRTALSSEISQLADEINRIGSETEFNGQSLMDGTYDLRGYTDSYGINIASYSDSVAAGEYTVHFSGLNTDNIQALMTSVDAASGGTEFMSNAQYSSEGNVVTITDTRGKEIQVELDLERIAADHGGTLPDSLDVTLDLKGNGEMNIMVGANEGQMLRMRLPEVSLKSLNLDELDYSTMEGCKTAIDTIKNAISDISSIRSRIGAYQNRLESTVDSLDVGAENMTSAYSRIMDVDMASEMTEYYTKQVLVQAGTSVLAQANSQPEQVLQLLQ